MRIGRVLLCVLILLFVLNFLLFAAWHGFNEHATRIDSKDRETMELYRSVVDVILIVVNWPIAGVLYVVEWVVEWLDVNVIAWDPCCSVPVWFLLLIGEAWLYSFLYVSWKRRAARRVGCI